MAQLLALAFTVAFVAVATGLGHLGTRFFSRGGRLDAWETLLLSFGMGAVVVHLSVFAVAPVALTRFSMAGMSAVLALLAIWGWRSFPFAEAIAAYRRLAADRAALLLALAALAVGGLTLLQGMAPPNTYDSLMYHLAVPRQDVERGIMAPAWNLGIHHILFPQMMGDLYRLTLVLAGERAVQMVSGVFGLVAAGAGAALVRRFGFGLPTAALAALMFLATRGVVWQMASAEVDVALAAMTTLALLALVAAGRHGDRGLLVLCGLLIGGALSIKTNGGPLALGMGVGMVWLAWRGDAPGRWPRFLLLAPSAASLIYLPQLLRMWQWTGNPLFPLANPLFNTDGAAFIQSEARSLDLVDFLVDPVLMFVAPTYKFDGMFLGSPYLLAFLPGLLLAGRRLPGAVPAALMAGVYYLFWWVFLNPQVRFLVHILPVISAFAAIGAACLWHRAAATGWRWPLMATMVVLALVQMQFVAIYAALRLPVALGLMNATDYHRNTPTMQGAYYQTCRYVAEHLPSGRSYVSLLVPHSYYCPQHSAIIDFFPDESKAWLKRDVPELTRQQVLQRFTADPPAFVIVATQWENRGNESRRAVVTAVDLERWRIGRHLATALAGLQPLSSDAYSAVYDGAAVTEALRGEGR